MKQREIIRYVEGMRRDVQALARVLNGRRVRDVPPDELRALILESGIEPGHAAVTVVLLEELQKVTA